MGFLRPRKLDKKEIEARVQAATPAPDAEHTAPLAEGFFKLERMREQHAQVRRKLKG